MIDHIGFPVSDYERAKTFYLKALAPLGYCLVMEVKQQDQPDDTPAAGFGANGKPDFWIGGEGGLNKPMHVAILASDRAAVDAFYKAAIAAGGRDNGAPGIRAHYHPITTAPSCSIPMATISKQCATQRHKPISCGTTSQVDRYGTSEGGAISDANRVMPHLNQRLNTP